MTISFRTLDSLKLPEPDGSVVLDDLARILAVDSSKYVAPTIDSRGHVINNAEYAQALAQSNVQLIPVRENQKSSFLFHKYVFFDELHWNPTEVHMTFARYTSGLESALEHPNGVRGHIDSIVHQKAFKDGLHFGVRGKLNSDEDLVRFHEPTAQLYADIRKYFGEIRSIDGIAFVPRE